MVIVFDVVKYILSKKRPITAMKLQKLVYYCQAWSLVWDGEKLFKEKIEAWANGPVVRELYNSHRGLFKIFSMVKGNKNNLKDYQRETIDIVLDFYGNKTSQWLSDLTHMELPWREARRGIPNGERGDNEITSASMEEYYSSLEISDIQ